MQHIEDGYKVQRNRSRRKESNVNLMTTKFCSQVAICCGKTYSTQRQSMDKI